MSNKSDNRIENLEIVELCEHTVRHHLGSSRGEKFKEIAATFRRMTGEIQMLRAINADLFEALEAFFLAAKMDRDLHPAWRVIYDAAGAALAKARGEANA